MRRILPGIVLLLAVAVVASVLLARRAGGRYVATMRLHVETPAAYEGDLTALAALLEESRANAEAGGLLSGMEETIHLRIDGRVAFTVVLQGGAAQVSSGPAPGATPTLVVDVTPQILENLRDAVADRKLEDAEIFNFAYVLLIPCLKRIHGMFYFTDPGDKRVLKVDDFMHFRLKNPEGFTYHGVPVEVAATVLSVDGYFFYLPGLVGEPDARYEFGLHEAIDLYRLLVYEAERHRGERMELLRLGRDAAGRLEAATAFTRAWH